MKKSVNTWYQKPYKPFLLVGVLSLLVSFIYMLIAPEAYFDVVIGDYQVISSYSVWLIFSTYIFILAAIYYIAEKSHLKTKKWLVLSHFIFVLLFLFLFVIFSSFNTDSVQRLVSGLPMLVLFGIYGTLFIIDVMFFFISVLFLFINILTFKKE